MNAIVSDEQKKDSALPRNFRNFLTLDASKLRCNTQGLKKLPCMASGQFTEDEFKKAISDVLPGNILVIDLRLEDHYFFDGKPYCWYSEENNANKDKTAEQILAGENARQEYFQYTEEVFVQNEVEILSERSSKLTQRLSFKQALTEEQLVSRLGCQYRRFTVLDHHRPLDTDVEAYLQLCLGLPKDKILYLHCRGGMGRATTFLIMMDIILNCELPLKDIIARHAEIGQKDVEDMTQYIPGKEQRIAPAKERLAFIESFYQFIKTDEYKCQSWSEYINQKDPKDGVLMKGHQLWLTNYANKIAQQNKPSSFNKNVEVTTKLRL